ncbi:hypothetical protein M0805_000430 [Coniferiporia weirii]|nr:hypothetical protein M0805_000430 [Coniferiporia weirii]
MNSSTSSLDNAVSAAASDDSVPARHANPVVAFIIGLAIILLASILNAGGLNLTKLDHVRTSSVPKSARRKDWLRPLWLIGMLLYILSQLIGSTLALQYLRAEYVAPLGSTSLIFNFLFASMLVGTPVTSTDIYGTIVVVVGVVGIVAFGSINSGLATEMDLARLKTLWGRANWLLCFMFMALALVGLFVFAAQLERVLAARADVSAVPFAGQMQTETTQASRRRSGVLGGVMAWLRGVGSAHERAMNWVCEKLELWTAAKDDKTIAWTLGIAWACCGGGLAGLCLVFAKASVKLISGKLSHENTGNQLLHIAAFVTFFFLALTAVAQIICLNRGLKVYDSTLVVPVFYGVYTGAGCLDALIFNNEISQYRSWTLFLIFVSILVLISGVVLLTHKKPDVAKRERSASVLSLAALPAARKGVKGGSGEEETLHGGDPEADAVVWELGNASDEDDETVHGDAEVEDGVRPRRSKDSRESSSSADGRGKNGLAGSTNGEEGRGLIRHGDADGEMDEW